MKKYRYIKPFDDIETYTDNEEVLELNKVYNANYKPKGWVYTIAESANFFPDHYELVNYITEIIEDNKAMRFNEGKPEWSLVHFKSLEPMVRVLEFGAKKYDRDNWKKDMSLDKILDSAQRHLASMIDGEDTDRESGLEHAGHVLCNMMFYIYHSNRKK